MDESDKSILGRRRGSRAVERHKRAERFGGRRLGGCGVLSCGDGGARMTALAIACLVTGGLSAVLALLASLDGATTISARDKMFFAGLFVAVWGAAFLLGAGQ